MKKMAIFIHSVKATLFFKPYRNLVRNLTGVWCKTLPEFEYEKYFK
jgi:hypothetical protein